MIDLSNISLQFGGKYLFQNVSFKIYSGDKISLVGANGTGKSSLLKIINGELQPESGSINKQKNINIGYLPQENVTHSGKKLLEEVKTALTDIIILQEKETELTEKLNEDLTDEERNDLVNQLGDVHKKLEDSGSYTAEHRIEKILVGLGFTEKDFDRFTDEFSGGWQMRIALAKMLVAQNDLMLMDEPTNHLDIDSLEWLIGYLRSYKGALLIVSHDKHFINSVTNRTLEIFLNQFYTYRGTYDDYLRFKAERDLQAQSLFEQQQRKIKETEKFIERFRYKATKAKQVQSRIKQLEKINLIELPQNKDDIYIKFPEPPSSGRFVMTLENINKSYGDKKVLTNINLAIERGEKIAFVGNNGTGKTTLAKIIAGVLDFNSGKRIEGHNTIISYYAQDVANQLDPDLDVLETVDQYAEDRTLGQLRSLLGSFLFTGDDVFKKVKVLSGGEKSRVALACILLTKANFIILDEPTNHLDISSKDILQKALMDFSGSLILVSHDVDFLSPITNKVIEIKPGTLQTYSGGIDYYLTKKQDNIDEDNKSRTAEKESTRRDQKRLEAELRQKKYQATKDLSKKIKSIEEKIGALEKKEKELEKEVFNPELWNDPVLARAKQEEHRKIRVELESLLNEWTLNSEELTKIEAQFNI